jgi:hypothetical protein
MEDRPQYEQVRRPFTDQEMADMHDALVQRLGDVEKLEAQKKQDNLVINAAIKGATKEVYDIRGKLAAGYEMIEVEVLAVMDKPKPGTKTIIRVDTSEELRTEPMSMRERQQSFGFTEPGDEK